MRRFLAYTNTFACATVVALPSKMKSLGPFVRDAAKRCGDGMPPPGQPSCRSRRHTTWAPVPSEYSTSLSFSLACSMDS